MAMPFVPFFSSFKTTGDTFPLSFRMNEVFIKSRKGHETCICERTEKTIEPVSSSDFSTGNVPAALNVLCVVDERPRLVTFIHALMPTVAKRPSAHLPLKALPFF